MSVTYRLPQKFQKLNPCNGCKERTVVCHSDCERHDEWLEMIREDKEKFLKHHTKESLVDSFIDASTARTKQILRSAKRRGGRT